MTPRILPEELDPFMGQESGKVSPMRPKEGSASGPSPFDEMQAPDPHEMMRDYGDKKALLRGSMISLNPQNPNYLDNLAAHVAHGEVLKNDHEHKMNSLGFGQMNAQTDASGNPMPQYGGPGKPVAQGEAIPEKELPQDEHKFRMQADKDKIAQAEQAGDHQTAGQAKIALADEARMNPWGTPGNHPGVLGKIGHIAGVVGNVAGNALLGPQNMSLIPGTQANLAAKEKGGVAEEELGNKEEAQQAENALRGAQQKHTEAEIPAVEAGAEKTKQETENLKNPPAKSLQDQLAARVSQDQKEGKDPATDTLAQQIADQITGLQKQGAQTEQSLDKQYNDAVKAGDHEAAKRILGEMRDLAVAKQSPQRPPQTTVILPGGQVETARPGMTLPEGTQNIGGFATMGRPTTQMRNVEAQAKVAVDGIPDTLKEIDTLRDQLGPVAGRWNDFMQGKIGMDNNALAGLQMDLVMLSSAVALAHARGRLPENLRAEFDRMIHAPQQSADNLITTIKHIQPWMERMSHMGETKGGAPTVGGGTTPKQSFADWKKSQGAANAP